MKAAAPLAPGAAERARQTSLVPFAQRQHGFSTVIPASTYCTVRALHHMCTCIWSIGIKSVQSARARRLVSCCLWRRRGQGRAGLAAAWADQLCAVGEGHQLLVSTIHSGKSQLRGDEGGKWSSTGWVMRGGRTAG